MHLNEGYRGLYIAHRAAEQEATELKWVSDWHRANPDKRNSFKRFIDKLLFRTEPIASSLINGIKMENQDVVTNLILDLSNRKISAPVRYRY